MKKALWFAVVVTVALLPSKARADERALIGIWRVMGRGPMDPDWVRAGLTLVTLNGGNLTITPIEFAATARDTRVGRNPTNLRVGPDGVSYQANFGREGMGLYRLMRRGPSTYEGMSTRAGMRFPIRWEKITSKNELRRELLQIITELKREKALSERLLSMHQQHLGEVQARNQLEDIRRYLGLPPHHNTIDGIITIYKTGDVAREQGRLAVVNEKLIQAEAALIQWTN
jgi:hypothetical protein